MLHVFNMKVKNPIKCYNCDDFCKGDQVIMQPEDILMHVNCPVRHIYCSLYGRSRA